jgi:hypothetical protein
LLKEFARRQDPTIPSDEELEADESAAPAESIDEVITNHLVLFRYQAAPPPLAPPIATPTYAYQAPPPSQACAASTYGYQVPPPPSPPVLSPIRSLLVLGTHPSHPSPLLGPLTFGLGPAALPFHHTSLQYLRAANVMEHLLLAFVHWQDAPSNEPSSSLCRAPGSAASLDLPTCLKDWIQVFPAMLPEWATRCTRCY